MMRVFIISDTHDNMDAARRFVAIVKKEKPDMIIHCGDYISPFLIRALLEAETRIIGVWGNNDGDKQTILNIISGTEFSIMPQPREIKIGDMDVLIIHGWQSPEKTKRLVRGLARGGKYKMIIYGHTHKQEIAVLSGGEIRNISGRIEISIEDFDALIVNPGEACGWLTGRRTYLNMVIDDKVVVEPREIPE